MGKLTSISSATLDWALIGSQDHVLFGPTYNTDLITDSALGQPEYLNAALGQFASEQTGLLSNPGADFLGKKRYFLSILIFQHTERHL